MYRSAMLVAALVLGVMLGGGQVAHAGGSTAFNCGPYLETYTVTSSDWSQPGKGIRCVKWTQNKAGSNLPAMAWYGEGRWLGNTYRHVGQAFSVQNSSSLVGYASDIYGNGEAYQGNYPGNISLTKGVDTIIVTGAWNEIWTKVANVHYERLPEVVTCGSLFDQYHAFDIGGTRRGDGLRCVMKIGRVNTTWYGKGNWDGVTYQHLATVSKTGLGASDLCGANDGFCNNFRHGSLALRYVKYLSAFSVFGWGEVWY